MLHIVSGCPKNAVLTLYVGQMFVYYFPAGRELAEVFDMALKHSESFDWATDAKIRYGYSSASTFAMTNTGGGRTGNCAQVYNENLIKDIGNCPTVITGVAIAPSDLADAPSIVLSLMDNGTRHLYIEGQASGVLKLYHGSGTLLGTTTHVGFILDEYHYIELKATIHNSAGAVVLRIDGENEIVLVGIDTQNTANAYANQVEITFNGYLLGARFCGFDDWYICDDTGPSENDFLGAVKIECIFPTGAGANTDFIPSAGANWQCVDDATPDDDATYVASATPGDIDTYTFGNLTATSGQVLALVPKLTGRKADLDTRHVKPVVRIAGVDYELTDEFALTIHYAQYSAFSTINPATGLPWTLSDVNGLETGQEVV